MITKTIGENKENSLIVSIMPDRPTIRIIRPDCMEDGIRYPAAEIYITDEELKEILDLIEGIKS